MARNLSRRAGSEVWQFCKIIDGVRHRKSTGFTDRRCAERWAVEYEHEVRKRDAGWSKPAPVTFAQWAGRYADSYGARKKDSRRDRQVLAHVPPAWQSRPLSAIATSDCEAYIAQRLHDGAASGTVRKEAALLKAMFNAAIKDGLLLRNPWQGIKLPPDVAKTRVLALDEQAALLAELKPRYQRLVIVALGTGLRENELLGIRAQDFSGPDATLHVRADRAKNGKARDVPLQSAVLAALEEQAAEPPERRKHGGAADGCMKGESNALWPMTGTAVRKCLSDAAKRAGIKPLCVHDLRRTFGTRCAAAGLPVPKLQRLMGHHSAEVTMKHYVHLQRADLAGALQRIDLGIDAGHIIDHTQTGKAA